MTYGKNTTHSFHLFNKDIQIGSMDDVNNIQLMWYMHSNSHGDSTDASKGPKDVLIELTDRSHEKEAKDYELEYHHLPPPRDLDDFTETCDDVHQTVKKATEEGKNVSIYCQDGIYIKNMILVSLKLRELIQEAASNDNSILDKEPIADQYVGLQDYPNIIVGCSPFVYQALKSIQTQYNKGENDFFSLNIAPLRYIEFFMSYESHIKAEIKKELGLSQSAPPPKPPKPPKPRILHEENPATSLIGQNYSANINSANVIQSCIDQCKQLLESCQEFGGQITQTVSSIKVPNFKLNYISETVSVCLGSIQSAASSAIEQLRSLSPEDMDVFSNIQEVMTNLTRIASPNLSRIGGALESAGRILSDIKLPDFSPIIDAVDKISKVASAIGGVVLGVISIKP